MIGLELEVLSKMTSLSFTKVVSKIDQHFIFASLSRGSCEFIISYIQYLKVNIVLLLHCSFLRKQLFPVKILECMHSIFLYKARLILLIKLMTPKNILTCFRFQGNMIKLNLENERAKLRVRRIFLKGTYKTTTFPF